MRGNELRNPRHPSNGGLLHRPAKSSIFSLLGEKRRSVSDKNREEEPSSLASELSSPPVIARIWKRVEPGEDVMVGGWADGGRVAIRSENAIRAGLVSGQRSGTTPAAFSVK